MPDFRVLASETNIITIPAFEIMRLTHLVDDNEYSVQNISNNYVTIYRGTTEPASTKALGNIMAPHETWSFTKVTGVDWFFWSDVHTTEIAVNQVTA